MIGKCRYFAVLLAASMIFCACRKVDTDPNEDWVPGERWIDTRDGQSYATVKIGDQVWMAENFKYLPDSGSWAYDNDAAMVSTYGRLYGWETAVSICPMGWHLPLQEEWQELCDFLGGRDVAGGKLKENGTSHWEDPNGGATNEVGFSALPGGYMWYWDRFQDLHEYAHFWTASKQSAVYVYTNTLSCLDGSMFDYNTMDLRVCACSVRYIKDQ